MFYGFCIITWWSSLVCPPHQYNLRQSCHLSRTSVQRRCHLLGYITCWRHCQVWDGEWWPCSWARTPAPGWWWQGLCSMGSHPCQNNLNTHSCLWPPSLPPAVQPTLGSYLHHALPLIDISRWCTKYVACCSMNWYLFTFYNNKCEILYKCVL